MTSHKSPISSVTASGDYIATAGYDNQVMLWSRQGKTFVRRGCHDHLANFVSFSPCGRLLLSTSSDYTARLWSVPQMRLVGLLGGHRDDVESGSFSDSGSYIATASRDHAVRIFDLDGRLLRTLTGHTADVLSVVWLDSDTALASCGDDGTIRIWNSADGSVRAVYRFDKVETDTCGIFRSWIYAGNDEGAINTIDAASGALAAPVAAHSAGIKSIRIHPGIGLLLSSSYDRSVKLWRIDPESGGLSLTDEIQCPASIWLRAVSILDEKTLAFGTFGSCYALFDRESREWDFSGVADTGGRNAVLATGEGVFSVGDSGLIFLDEKPLARASSLCNFLLSVGDLVITGGQTGEIFEAHSGRAFHLHHSPVNCGATFEQGGNTYAIVGTYTGEGILFRYKAGALYHEQTVKLHSNAIKGIASNGRSIFSVCANTDAAFHDAGTLELLRHIPGAHRLIANGAAWRSGEDYASISRDRVLRLWNGQYGCEEVATPHTHSIKCLAVSATNPELIATGSYSGMCCLYNAGRKEWLRTVQLTSAGISSLCYSAAEDVFLASSYDGSVYRLGING